MATDVSKSEPEPGLEFHLRFASPSHSHIRVRAFMIDELLIIEDSFQYVGGDEYGDCSHEAVIGDKDDEAAAI